MLSFSTQSSDLSVDYSEAPVRLGYDFSLVALRYITGCCNGGQTGAHLESVDVPYFGECLCELCHRAVLSGECLAGWGGQSAIDKSVLQRIRIAWGQIHRICFAEIEMKFTLRWKLGVLK